MLEINSVEYNKRLSKYKKELKRTEEVWKEIFIKGCKTNYAISNFGNICNMETGKTKENDFARGKYININFKISDIKSINTSLHRLVAFYFCEIPKELKEQGFSYDKLVVNHINGIKSCDAAFNLEWVTEKENMQHAFNTALCTEIFGEKSHLSKITEKEVKEICKLIMKKKTNKEISELTGITEKTIQHIRSKEDWVKVTEKYDFPKLSANIPYSLDENKIHETCKLLELHKYSDPEIAKMCNLKRETVKDIRLGKRRTDISSQYNIDPAPFNPINDEMIESVCKLLEEGKLSQRKIAKEAGISQCLVSEIYNHKKFTEISSKYNFNN